MMWLRRLAWGIGLTVPAACFILTERTVFAAVFCMAALIPLPSLLLLLLCGKITADIRLPDSIAVGERAEARILLRGRGPVSVMRIQARVSLANLLTGETALHPIRELFPVSGGAEAVLSLECALCGKVSLDVHQALVYDLLGLFRRKFAVSAHASMLVLPNTFEPRIDLSAPDSPDIESDEYSPNRPGNDPSELFGIRDYREGDLLKSIHWKLSEKYDRTVVKEMSLPVAQSILLLLNNCPKTDADPAATAAACEALVSVSQSLADLNIAHHIGWFGRETGVMHLSDVASLDDLSGEQALLLASRVVRDEAGLINRLLDDPAVNTGDFHRVLIFSACPVPGTAALPGNVTVLLPEEAPEGALSCLPGRLTRILI